MEVDTSSVCRLFPFSGDAVSFRLVASDFPFESFDELDDRSDEFRATTVVPIYTSILVLGNSLQQDERYTDLIVLTDRFNFELDAIRTNLEFENALAMRRLLTLQKLEELGKFRTITEDLITALGDGAS